MLPGIILCNSILADPHEYPNATLRLFHPHFAHRAFPAPCVAGILPILNVTFTSGNVDLKDMQQF